MIGGLLLSFRRLVIVTGGWRVAGDSCAAGLMLWFGHWCVAGGVSWTTGVRPMCPVSSGLDFQAKYMEIQVPLIQVGVSAIHSGGLAVLLISCPARG